MQETQIKEIINCTPHPVNELNSGITFPPSGITIRLEEEIEDKGNIEFSTIDEKTGEVVQKKIPIIGRKFKNVQGLPEEKPGTLYIVSALVKQAVPERKDLIAVGELVRDDAGYVKGAKGFVL